MHHVSERARKGRSPRDGVLHGIETGRENEDFVLAFLDRLILRQAHHG
jgi:hypothetical protein